ncbi:MAG: hypothetical protein KIT39_20310 [Nitrospirales bacterium]|nr:hypothetical protein [Nitrospirales bacterium]
MGLLQRHALGFADGSIGRTFQLTVHVIIIPNNFQMVLFFDHASKVAIPYGIP